MIEHLVHAFPGAPGGGNPAGVVLGAREDLDAAEFTRIAVRINPLSETAFVWPGEPGAPIRLRYFAPGGEVRFCGHATAGAFAVLAREGLLPPDGAVRAVAPGAEVTGRAAVTAGDVVVWMEMPVARRIDARVNDTSLASALGITAAELAADPLPRAVEDVGIRIHLIPLPTATLISELRPDMDALRRLGAPDSLIVHYPFHFDDAGAELTVRSRSFAPAVDIDEDPATGTAAAALGAFLAREGCLAGRTSPARVRIRQALEIGRPSEILLEVEHDGRRPLAVRIGGRVVPAPGPGGGVAG